MAKPRRQEDHRPVDNVQHARPAIQETFDQWFTRMVGSKGLPKSMKNALREHMKAYGFYQKGQYDDGLRHFGM